MIESIEKILIVTNIKSQYEVDSALLSKNQDLHLSRQALNLSQVNNQLMDITPDEASTVAGITIESPTLPTVTA